MAGNDSYTKLLLHFEGADESQSTTDHSDSEHSITFVGSAKIDSAQKVFGQTSLKTDNTTDYVYAPYHADFTMGTGRFMIETRFRIDTAVPANVTGIFHIAEDSENQVRLWFSGSATNKLSFYSQENSGTEWLIEHSWIPAADTWYHIAAIRGWGNDDNSIALTVNGTALGTTDVTGKTWSTMTSGNFNIGYYGGVTQNNWLDEFRVSKGIARETANFSVETNPYTRAVKINSVLNFSKVSLKELQYINKVASVPVA